MPARQPRNPRAGRADQERHSRDRERQAQISEGRQRQIRHVAQGERIDFRILAQRRCDIARRRQAAHQP